MMKDLRSRVGWLLIAIAYFFAFFQRVSFQGVNGVISSEMNLSPEAIGIIGSSYFYGYMLMQIPAGVLTDTLGVKKSFLLSLCLSLIGTLLFFDSHTLHGLILSRLILAAGDSLVFTILLKYTAQIFEKSSFGFFAGVSQVAGYLGGLAGATPLILLADATGWRTPFIAVALCLFCILLLAAYFVARPASQCNERFICQLHATITLFFSRFSDSRNWGLALFFASQFIALSSLSSVWGIPMVSDVLHIDHAQAGMCAIAFMAFNAIGSLYGGYRSDQIPDLPAALIKNSLARLVFLLALLPSFCMSLGFVYTVFCFVFLGFFCGCAVPLLLKTMSGLFPPDMLGITAAFNTTFSGLLAASAQPLFGWILKMTSESAGTFSVIAFPGYSFIMLLLAASSLLGVIGPRLIQKKQIFSTH